jgi:ankyrin repeat protein
VSLPGWMAGLVRKRDPRCQVKSMKMLRQLPKSPRLQQFKDEAKKLLKTGSAMNIRAAQAEIARQYGFAAWRTLKEYVDFAEEIAQLKRAIDSDDLNCVKELMSRCPALHQAPIGYGRNGPLTWAAECRIPWGPPSTARLEMVEWMIQNGSNVHQGGDAPLMRAALVAHRIPMMDLLVSCGANVNGVYGGYFPVILAPAETLEPASLQWLLDHGANLNCVEPGPYPNTALDHALSTYSRTHQLGACIDVLLAAGGSTRYNIPAVLDLLRGRLDRLAEQLDADPALLQKRFPELDIGVTGTRLLTLKGATLLHVTAEYGIVEAARLLLDRGADVNARADLDANGIGGQTPLFHSVTQFSDWGLPVVRLLLDRGADLTVRVKIPGHYSCPGEVVECTPLGYARLFPGGNNSNGCTALLQARGGL